MKLTKATIAGIAIPAGRSEVLVFDDALPGFGVRLREGGSKTFIIQAKIAGATRRTTIGRVAVLDLDEARRRAKAALAKIQLGFDPTAERAAAKAEAAVTVGHVVEDYLVRRAAKKLRASTLDDVTRYLKVHWAPLWPIPVRKVTRSDVAAGLARITMDSGEYAANRARAALGAMYKWAVGEGVVDANPVVGTHKPADEVARDRALSDAELAIVLRNVGTGDYGDIVRLLVLTAQRREEIAGMRWPEVDLDAAVWRIPVERAKNKRAHDVPLAAAAVSILQARRRREESHFVFGAGKGAFSGFSKAKAALDARIATDVGSPLPAWRLHDLRRSTATRMADLGVLPHVIEAILNHISGHKAGVAGVYNRSSYAAEKRAALDLWGHHVEAFVRGKKRKTVQNRRENDVAHELF